MSVLPTLDELSTPSASCSGQGCLLDIDTRMQQMTKLLKRNLSLLGVIAAVCERFGGDCLRKTDHIMRFAQVPVLVLLKVLNCNIWFAVNQLLTEQACFILSLK